MFITEVIGRIWEPVSQEYHDAYQLAEGMSDDELFQDIRRQVEHAGNFVFSSRELNMTRVLTSGCSHSHRNGKFSGCSMCDYMSLHGGMLAKVAILKGRNPRLYAKAMRFSFDNARGKSPRPAPVELITGHDTLSPEEIPDEAFDEMFNSEDALYSRKPYKAIFESRISSITYDRLVKWKEKLGRRIAVEVGIEVWDEWVRNHWIHKNVTEAQIVEALRVVEETGCEISANILIGIPGLTEDLSIELFKETYRRLSGIGVHYILCSPLGRKEKTLQGYLYNRLRHNERLAGLGLVHGEETGMPSVFTVMEAVAGVIRENPDSLERLTLSPINMPIYFELVRLNYAGNEDMLRCTGLIEEALHTFQATRNPDALFKLQEDISGTDSYKAYRAWKDQQNQVGGLARVLEVLGEELARELWPGDWEERVGGFRQELGMIHAG